MLFCMEILIEPGGLPLLMLGIVGACAILLVVTAVYFLVSGAI